MLKVWVWKNRTGDLMARLSPVEPNKHVRPGERDHYSHPLDLVICGRYIKRITGHNPRLKPKAFWFSGNLTRPTV